MTDNSNADALASVRDLELALVERSQARKAADDLVAQARRQAAALLDAARAEGLAAAARRRDETLAAAAAEAARIDARGRADAEAVATYVSERRDVIADELLGVVLGGPGGSERC